MTKIETVVSEYDACWECGHSECFGINPITYYCRTTSRAIPDISEIPDWCQLEDKKDES